MSVIKLDASHSEACKQLFTSSSYFSPISNTVDKQNYAAYARCGYGVLTHGILCDNYLAPYHENTAVWGLVRDNSIVTALCAYYSSEEPAWYLMAWRNTGTPDDFKSVLNAVTVNAESEGKYKFYMLESPQHANKFRAEHMSDIRGYDYFEEFIVQEKQQCYYVYHWEMLFHRLLIPETTVSTCYFLKQEHRKHVPNGGSL